MSATFASLVMDLAKRQSEAMPLTRKRTSRCRLDDTNSRLLCHSNLTRAEGVGWRNSRALMRTARARPSNVSCARHTQRRRRLQRGLFIGALWVRRDRAIARCPSRTARPSARVTLAVPRDRSELSLIRREFEFSRTGKARRGQAGCPPRLRPLRGPCAARSRALPAALARAARLPRAAVSARCG